MAGTQQGLLCSSGPHVFALPGSNVSQIYEEHNGTVTNAPLFSPHFYIFVLPCSSDLYRTLQEQLKGSNVPQFLI